VIYQECEALVAAGAREITLLGQNVNSYGADLGLTFVDLLKLIVPIKGLERIRFTTSNPHDFTEELAELFYSESKMGRYLHLPVQSGSDRILGLMKRKVTAHEYWKKIEWLRQRIPDMAISTDLIVGFPGETEEDFSETLQLVEKVGFSFCFSFKYSPRKNTPAARFTDQISEAIKDDRLRRLNLLQDQITIAQQENEIGKIRPVLFHYESKKNPGHYYGRTEHFRLVRTASQTDLVGTIREVKVIEANKTALIGDLAY
jgi:tRNA-2-methylthio-N6-dimethylallyladenosine synthase